MIGQYKIYKVSCSTYPCFSIHWLLMRSPWGLCGYLHFQLWSFWTCLCDGFQNNVCFITTLCHWCKIRFNMRRFFVWEPCFICREIRWKMSQCYLKALIVVHLWASVNRLWEFGFNSWNCNAISFSRLGYLSIDLASTYLFMCASGQFEQCEPLGNVGD